MKTFLKIAFLTIYTYLVILNNVLIIEYDKNNVLTTVLEKTNFVFWLIFSCLFTLSLFAVPIFLFPTENSNQ